MSDSSCCFLQKKKREAKQNITFESINTSRSSFYRPFHNLKLSVRYYTNDSISLYFNLMVQTIRNIRMKFLIELQFVDVISWFYLTQAVIILFTFEMKPTCTVYIQNTTNGSCWTIQLPFCRIPERLAEVLVANKKQLKYN